LIFKNRKAVIHKTKQVIPPAKAEDEKYGQLLLSVISPWEFSTARLLLQMTTRAI